MLLHPDYHSMFFHFQVLVVWMPQLVYQGNLGRVFEWKMEGHFSLRNAHMSPNPLLKFQCFW